MSLKAHSALLYSLVKMVHYGYHPYVAMHSLQVESKRNQDVIVVVALRTRSMPF